MHVTNKNIENLEPALQQKWHNLLEQLRSYGKLGIAYSGGVDSGLLSAAAYEALGDQMLAITIQSPVETREDTDFARQLAEKVGFPHLVIPFNDLENPGFVANPANRCYHCKKARLHAIQQAAAGYGITHLADGSNASDSGDYRPGTQAVREAGAHSPLAEVGLTKPEIRALSKALDLPIWDRPSAPCLATRFPYGTPITVEGLGQIAKAENFLRELDFEPLRVRYHQEMARIEVAPQEIERLLQHRDQVLKTFKEIGFRYVTVDLQGYRSGSMNEVLE